ncbi:MAG TPA: XRE family transcriptional regulator [Methylotenera sp.]
MDRLLFAIAFIVAVILILAPTFIWINNNFNNEPEKLDELEDGALMKLAIKIQLLNELQQWINDNNLSTEQIGVKLVINRKTIANILYQRVDKFTIDTLIDLVFRTEKKV